MEETTRSVESSVFCSGAWLWPRLGIMLSGLSVEDHGLDDDDADEDGAIDPEDADLDARYLSRSS